MSVTEDKVRMMSLEVSSVRTAPDVRTKKKEIDSDPTPAQFPLSEFELGLASAVQCRHPQPVPSPAF